jgi:hypothetical protein
MKATYAFNSKSNESTYNSFVCIGIEFRRKNSCEKLYCTQASGGKQKPLSFKAENTNFQPLKPKSFRSSEELDVVFVSDIVEAYFH